MQKKTIEKIDTTIEKLCDRIQEATESSDLPESTKALAELITARARVKVSTNV